MSICPTHRPKNEKMGYVAYSEWMERQPGQQRQCQTCGLWFFRAEYGAGWKNAAVYTQPTGQLVVIDTSGTESEYD